MSHQSDLCSQTEAICWTIAAPNQFNIFRRKGIMPNDRGFLDRRIEQAPALVSGQKSASCHFALPLRRITKLTPKRLALEGGHSLPVDPRTIRSEEHTSELQSLMRISYAVFCLKKKKTNQKKNIK